MTLELVTAADSIVELGRERDPERVDNVMFDVADAHQRVVGTKMPGATQSMLR